MQYVRKGYPEFNPDQPRDKGGRFAGVDGDWAKLKDVIIRRTADPLEYPDEYDVQRKRVPVKDVVNSQEHVHLPSVQRYAQSMRDGTWDETSNPPKLIDLGDGKYIVIAGEGHHRLAAHDMAGKTHVLADVYREKANKAPKF
jgi:hypothetical protein